MSTTRFGLLTACLFALAFIGISWASKGFPVLLYKTTELRPDSRLPTFKQVTEDEIRKKAVEEQTNQSDGNKERDELRLALLQASTAYKLSPCDPTMKRNLITAVTNYVTAWQDMAGCGYGRCKTTGARLDQAAAAFQTPADKNLSKVLLDAYEQGGVRRVDFPDSVRANIYTFSGMPFANKSTCGGEIDGWN